MPMLIVFDKLSVEEGLCQTAVKTLAASEVFFIVDIGKIKSIKSIVLNLNTGYFDKGLLVMRRKSIALTYLKSTLAYDLICSVPVFLIIHAT